MGVVTVRGNSGSRLYWGEVFEKTSLARRKKAIENDLLPYVESIFKKRPELKSALFLVAQYWADEANDAVHARVVFSKRETPLWPHPCRWNDDKKKKDEEVTEVCSMCATGRSDFGWMPFDDNGEGIVAFQSCCREDASQESEENEAYLPYAIVRRTSAPSTTKTKSKKAPELSVEIVGGPIRAWLEDATIDDEDMYDDEDFIAKLTTEKAPPATPRKKDDEATLRLFDLVYASPDDNGPRAVLADHLQQKGDPLGEYIALAVAIDEGNGEANEARPRNENEAARKRAEALEVAHGRSWLGPLATVAPADHIEWDRGFVRKLSVYLGTPLDVESVLQAREWGPVQELHFLRQGTQILSPAMRSLRRVGPLDANGLAALMKVGSKLERLDTVQIVLENKKMLSEMAKLDLPTLRTLIVSTTAGGPGNAQGRTARNPFTGEMMELPATSTSFADLGPKVLASILTSPSWKRLDELVVTSADKDVIASWLAQPVSKRPRTLTFTGITPLLEPGGFRLRVTTIPSKDTSVATLDMPSLNADVSLDSAANMLGALPAHVTEVIVASTRFFSAQDNDFALLKKAAATAGRKVRRE